MNGESTKPGLKERIIVTALMPFLFCDLHVLMSKLIPGAHAILKSMQATLYAHDDTFTKIKSIPDEHVDHLAGTINVDLRGCVNNKGEIVKERGVVGKGTKPHHIVEKAVDAVYSQRVLGN